VNLRFPPSVALLTAALFSVAALAQTPTLKTPPALTSAQIKQRLAPALARLKQQQLAEVERLNLSLQPGLKALEPERAALSKALNADPRYKTYLAQAERIAKGGGTPRERADQLRALSRSNRVILDDAVRASGVNRAVFQSKIGPGAVNSDLSVRISRPASHSVAPASNLPPLTPSEIDLGAPFDFEDVDTNNGGIAYQAADGSTNPTRGRARSEVVIVGLAGGARTSAEIGKTFTVPEGFNKFEITVTVETEYSLAALGSLGASVGCAFNSILVYDLNGNDGGSADAGGECIFAPVAWFSEAEGKTTRDYKLKVSLVGSNRDFLVRASTYASSTGAGVPGYAESLARADISRIRVKFIK